MFQQCHCHGYPSLQWYDIRVLCFGLQDNGGQLYCPSKFLMCPAHCQFKPFLKTQVHCSLTAYLVNECVAFSARFLSALRPSAVQSKAHLPSSRDCNIAFDSALNVSIAEFETNLVPYPRTPVLPRCAFILRRKPTVYSFVLCCCRW